jgi:hypothetical protein
MRDSYAESDPSAATSLTLLHGSEHFSIVPAHAFGEMPSELSNDTGLVTGRDRHDDLVRTEDLGQEHGAIWAGMKPNLNRVKRRGNALV